MSSNEMSVNEIYCFKCLRWTLSFLLSLHFLLRSSPATIVFVYFQKGGNAEKFFSYIVERVLPILEEINGEETGDLKLDLLKILAEICTHKISDEILQLSLEPIFTKLLVRIKAGFHPGKFSFGSD